MKLKTSVLFACLALVLSSCFKEEKAIEPFPRGDVNQQSIAMGATYADQFFYSLDKNSVVKQVPKTAWDISFDCKKDSKIIRLNTGKNMYAAKTSATNLSEISDTNGLKFTWDWSHGGEDSLALVGWNISDFVYVINLGMDENLQPLGFVKAKFTYQNEALVIQYMLLNSRTEQTFTLQKDDAYNAVYFSFIQNVMVNVEPLKTEYDLVFRQYIYYFAPEKLAYLVVGALLNPNSTKVSRIFNKDFETIEVADTITHPFTKRLDAIGYDWKEFKLSVGEYIIYSKQNYLIQDNKGFFFKLHFTAFYSPKSGEKGHPGFEFKRL